MSIANDESVNFSYLPELSVDSILSHEVLTVYEGWSVNCLIGFFMQHNLSIAPVVAADGELVGEVSLFEVVEFQCKQCLQIQRSCRDNEQASNRLYDISVTGPGANRFSGDAWALGNKRTVNTIMKKQVASVDITEKASVACGLLLDQGLEYLYVTEHDRLVGAVTANRYLMLMAG